jgi:hypothetical protein
MILCKSKYVKFVQYMAAKPIKHGIKVFSLCCSYTGYLYAFDVYLGKEFTKEGSATEICSRLIHLAKLAGQGEGRTLVTDNWYTSTELMMRVYQEFKMSLIGTFTPTKKVSRTADDFPFTKLSNGALKMVSRGWDRVAYQNVYIGNNKVPSFTVQATIWKDKKLVGMLHNFEISNRKTQVLRYSPTKKAKKEVSSPEVIPVYSAHYNGVDRKDRDTADWSIALKSKRWYLSIFYWIIDGLTHAQFITVSDTTGEEEEEHPWVKYLKRDGRAEFQLDVGLALIERGIMMDCPNIADLKDKSKRPAYMRKTAFVPCGCQKCFFCKNGFTRGATHKPPPGMPRFRVKLGPPSPAKPPIEPNKHSRKRVVIKKHVDWCKVCMEREKKSHPDMSQDALRGTGRIRKTRHGCLECASGRGTIVCEPCWSKYCHDL